MDRFFQVARTYWRRPRFWVFGGWYAFITLLPSWRAEHPNAALILFLTAISAVFASLVATFVALHVRRQFGTPQAHLTPHFAWPHFIVATIVTLAIWVGVPWIMAIRAGVPPIVLVSLHAVVAIVAAAVTFWPKISIVLAVVPLLLIWPAMVMDRYQTRSHVTKSHAEYFAEDFAAGRTRIAYAGLLALAAASYPIAAWRLKRLSDVAVATSDDFTIEPPGTARASNPATDFLHAWRDTHIEWKLTRPARWFAAIERRRIPSAPSWPQMACFAALVLVLMGPAWWTGGDPIGAWLVLSGGTLLMVFAPYSFWRFRVSALATEMMRPATRESTVRDVMLAMAGDFFVWTVLATITMGLGYTALLGWEGFGWRGELFHIAFLWCLAVWSFGIALATLHLRYWMPVFAFLLIGSIAGLLLLTWLTVWVIETRHLAPWLNYLPIVLFPGGLLAIGLVLCARSYGRWRTMDVA